MSLSSFFGKDWTTARNGGLRFVARHPILSEIADQLASFDLGDLVARHAAIYVGAHSFTKRLLPPGFKIGLQTEHFYDQTGAKLWGLPSRAAILRWALQYDILLDVSPLNAPAYEFLPGSLRRKIKFGPHLFPDTLPAYAGSSGDLIFFGAMNDRRRAEIAKLGQLQSLQVLPYGTHGQALQAQITRAGGIVNLHFSAGVYSEYPRLLTAALAGKAVWSDPLAQPLICGQHYFALTDRPSLAEQSAVYDRFCSAFAAKHRLSDFLRAVLPV
jgi:hypothetical protein